MDLHGAFHVYDTTLRDGTQREGLSLSVEDKLRIARQLDVLGVHYIEGGFPGSNPKDIEFFERAPPSSTCGTRRLTAFGPRGEPASRRRRPAGRRAARHRRAARCVVGKSVDRHVEPPCARTLEENLAMVRDSVALPAGPRGAGLLRRRALLRRLQRQPRLRARGAARRGRGGRRRGRAVRHQRRHAAARGRRHRRRRRAGAPAPARHPLPQRLRLRGRQLARRGRGRRDARAGHDQRLRRAHRQRRPHRDHRRPRAQDATAPCCPTGSCEATRIATSSPRPPTSRRTRASPTSARARSRTRAACTRARPRSTRTPTSTSTRPRRQRMRMLVSELAGRASLD